MTDLRLFGGAMLTDADGVITPLAARRHPLALLALLATAPSHTLTRAKLVGLLWPEAPETTARNRLTTTVHRIRRTLGRHVLVGVGDDLRLDTASIACDVCAFQDALAAEDHRRTVELYGGPFLDGFFLDGSSEFEHWIDRARDHLRRGYQGALEALAGQAEQDGDPGAAAPWWRLRAADDPFDSRVARRLIEALLAAGNRAEAVRVADSHTRLLEEEFGTAPDGDLATLIRSSTARPAAGNSIEPSHADGEPRGDGAAGSAVETEPAPFLRPGGPRAEPAPARRSGGLRTGLPAAAIVAAVAAGAIVAVQVARMADGAGAVEQDQALEAVSARTAAHELYLQAERLRRITPGSEDRNERMVELYRRALELDSAFAPAWAGLAGGYLGRAWMGDGRAIWADSVRIAAHRALALDPAMALAHARLGDSYWPAGALEPQLAAYRRALEIEPGHHVAANNMIVMLILRGRIAAAMHAAVQEHDRKPRSAALIGYLAYTNSMLGRDAVADRWLERARALGQPLLEQEFRIELLHRGRSERARRLLERSPPAAVEAVRARQRGALALYERDWSEARRQYRTLFTGPAGTSSPIHLGFLADRLGLAWSLDRPGDREAAAEIAAEVAARAEREIEYGDRSSLPRERLAVASLMLGDTAGAIGWLEDAVDAGYRDLRLALTLPMLEPLRGRPRFRAWLDRLDKLLAEERRRADAVGTRVADPPPGTVSGRPTDVSSRASPSGP